MIFLPPLSQSERGVDVAFSAVWILMGEEGLLSELVGRRSNLMP